VCSSDFLKFIAESNIEIIPAKSATDLATLLGLLGAFLFVIFAIFSGRTPGSFINIPSMMIVLCGTAGITMMCFSMKEVLQTFKVILKTMSYNARDSADAAIQVLQIAELARRWGFLSLQPVLSPLSGARLFVKVRVYGGGWYTGRRSRKHLA